MNFGEGQFARKTEVSAATGIAILVAVAIFVFAPHESKTFSLLGSLWSLLWSRNENLMSAGIGAALFSAAYISWEMAAVLGVVKRGKKMDELRNDGIAIGAGARLRAIVAAVLVGFVAYLALACVWIPREVSLFEIKGAELHSIIEKAFRGSFALLALVLTYGLGTLPVWRALAIRCPRRLPRIPKVQNALVLGAVDEEEPGKKPTWAVMGLRGLVGNILITGSIGSGKSAGTVFSFARQLLTNFEPRPAFLAIDPKGKIATKIQEIAEDEGLGEHVLHMKLDGDVRFNPIYHPTALKSGGFSDIAKMIRSAAVNYMGKSFDSPFWEQSASTLVKNCLIHCAATKRYYTLNDLYTTMVRAVSSVDEFMAELEACLKRDDLDVEEKANISFALQYFKREYHELDEKVRTGILATSTTFLNQFQEYQSSEIFCPSEEDLTIRSMDEVLDHGKILLFDITNDGLARSMGTFIKLHYEKALLNRLKQGRSTERPGVLIVDEYQDVVTTGYGTDFGDETFLAEGREANAISIMATQSLSSLENSIGRDKPTQVLWMGFRTKILGHSSDLSTIKAYQELAGKEDKRRISRSVSEHSQDGMALGLGSQQPQRSNVSESVSASEQKEYVVTAQDFARLNTFEAFMMMFDGVGNVFKKLYLKPYYLKDKRMPHRKILASLRPAFSMAFAIAGAIGVCGSFVPAHAFPNVCTVLKSSESSSCMNFSVGMCMCGWPIPRPCANFSYYVPTTFVEVMPEPKSSFFGDMPGAAAQLATLGSMPIPYAAESDDDTHAFQAHVTSVPLTMIPFQTLPCGGGTIDRLCFEGMSEHLGSNWTTGSADMLQPNFLAWSLSPKGCLLKGAAMSVGGESGGGGMPAMPSCSVPMSWLPKYPPSTHSACTGWGTFYPRTGIYGGPAQTTGALMVAARMKSLSNEVFRATPSSGDEIWQMIYPQSSSCFREGQNVGILDATKNVREIGRLTSGKLTGYLFTVWSRVSCCRDLALVPEAYAALAAMNLVCQGLGNL